MKVPFYNFQDLHNEAFRTRVLERIADIMLKNTFVEGHYHDLFQKEFANMQKAKHCLLVANGTDALEISLKAHDIGPGHKVGVPDITFYASAEAVINVGAQPIFIDVDPISGLICPQSLARVNDKFGLDAVMPVHIYGLPAPIKEIEEICNPKQIPIIEDAAQAQGTLLPDGPVGCTNNLTTFSFYPTKNLSAMGDAGCILTQSDELASKIKTIRNHGRGDEPIMGRNSRCDHMQAAILHLKLEQVEQYNQSRKAIAKKYHEVLKELPITLLPDHFLETSSWHLYPIQLESVEKRQQLQNFLQENEVGCVGHYYDKSVSQLKIFDQFEGETEVARSFVGRTLCLPMSPFLGDAEIEYVAKLINQFSKS